MNKPDLIESIALQIADGEDPRWELDSSAGNSAVFDNLQILHRLARTLRDQDDLPDMPASWGSLKIVARLGSGATADVYRAHDPALQRDVALKLFRSRDPESQQRLLEEGRMMARVRHPNVVQIFGAERHDGRIGLWMELVDGQTLEDLLERQGTLGAAEAATVGRQLCAALAAVHSAGLLYRDLKLQNVIRESGGAIRLTDFGSGIAADGHVTGRISGTPLYLAPELFDDVPPSAQSDIYALGVVLYRLVSGTFPVEADSVEELQASLARGHRPLLDARPDLPAAFVACVEKSIATDPGARHSGPGELATELAGLEAAGARRRARWPAATALAAAALVVWLALPVDYQLDTRLYRLNADASRSELVNGSTVAVGDDLLLELTSSVPLYVYVFNEDATGNAWGLFPLAWAGHRNPLAADETHFLPSQGDGELAWTVDSAGVVERIHILASPEPVAEVEAAFAALPPARLATGALASRGVGSMGRREGASPMSAASLVQRSRQLAGSAEALSGVTYRVIELDNPET